MEIFGASAWGLGAAARPFVGLRCVAWRSGIVNPTGPGPGPALGGVNSRAPRGRRPVVYLQPAGNSDRPPIRYNIPFTTCVRGLCHGIQPCVLPAHADRPAVGVSHARLVVAIGARRRSTDTTHARDATPQTLHGAQTLSGLTRKPSCAACEQALEAPRLPPSPPPPPTVPSTRGRRRHVDTSDHFCPDRDCRYGGWLGLGNITSNGHPSGGPWRQLHCTGCGGYFQETHGTPLHGKRVAPDLLVWAVGALAEGWGIRAVAR